MCVCACELACANEFSVQEKELDVERTRFIRFALGISPRYVGGSRGISKKSSLVSLVQHFVVVRTLRGDNRH